MHAKIYHQDLIDEDAMKTSSQTSLTGKLLGECSTMHCIGKYSSVVLGEYSTCIALVSTIQ